jgi:hypothetical protein
MKSSNDTSREPRFHDPNGDLTALLSEWGDLCARCMDKVDTFTRERPVASLAIAIFAGTFLGSLFRRR